MTVASDQPVILYDLPSDTPCQAWSPNTLKTRFLLNYKQIPYTTEWVDYPDVDARMTEEGIERAETFPFQTLPAVKIPGLGVYKDSDVIVQVIEENFQQPLVRPDDSDVRVAIQEFNNFRSKILKLAISLVPCNLLDHHNAKYFYETRATMFDKPLEDIQRDLKNPESEEYQQVWREAQEAMISLDALLNRNVGPFVFGAVPSYADIVISANLKWFERLDEKLLHKVFNLCHSGRLQEIWMASMKWQNKLD